MAGLGHSETSVVDFSRLAHQHTQSSALSARSKTESVPSPRLKYFTIPPLDPYRSPGPGAYSPYERKSSQWSMTVRSAHGGAFCLPKGPGPGPGDYHLLTNRRGEGARP